MLGLTKPQKIIYDMEKFAGGSIATVCGGVMINGVKDENILTAAINEIYRINDALRTRITEKDGIPYQTILEYKEQKIPVLRFKDKQELDAYAEKYAKEPMDFYGPLCELSAVVLDGKYGILGKFHHIISDAWTLSLVGSQYSILANGNSPEAYSYLDYVSAEKDYLESKRYPKDREYYIEQYKKCDEATYLSDKQITSYIADRKHFIIDNEKTAKIVNYANEHKTSVYMLLMTALGVYMNRVKMNQEKFYIGTAILNRTNVREKNTVGMFINTAPVLIELNNDEPFAENLKINSRTLFGIIKHQKFNYIDVLETLRSEFDFSGNLYDVVLSYQNAKMTGMSDDFESTWYHCGMQTESLQIHIDDRDSEGILKIHYDYQTEKFTEKEIEMMHSHIMALLFDAIENDSVAISKLNMTDAREKDILLNKFNDTYVKYDDSKCFHELFSMQAKRTPDMPALIFEDEIFTFEQLDEMSNSLAHFLRENGIKPNDVVPIISKRSWHIFVAIIAINKAGGAFMSVDPSYPEDRIQYMLNEAKSSVALYLDYPFEFGIKGVDLESFDFDYNPQPVKNINTSDDLTYVIFTSGSTGKPKGLTIRHKNAANFCNKNHLNICDKILKADYNVFLSVTNTIFDMFITECFIPLTNGYTILFANDAQAMSPVQLSKLCKKYKPDVMETTPTKLKAYISNCENLEYLQNMKAIILGGEALPESLLEELRTLTQADIFNNYGPAETTVWSTIEKTSDDEITIGKPIANTQIYILDKYENLLPTGVIGEICIAGDGVGAGYLNRPELTEERFVDNPFSEGKMYKTGDLGYWREDGNIIYIGRNDFQVKIRGLRIELGEIEDAIDSVDGVSQAVVAVRKDNSGRQLICAFYTEDKKVDVAKIKSEISARLPKYMVPHIFTAISKMPLTTSGKINRKALPEVDLTCISNETEYVKPENKLQQKLADVVQRVLNYEPVGLNDDFFDLGGDSLKAIELVSRAHSEGIYFNLQAVFDNPTVGKLYDHIQNTDKQAVVYKHADFEKYQPILENNKATLIEIPRETELGSVFVTGSTGYLGSHVIDKLLDNGAKKVYCLVRNDAKRLFDTLSYYFEDKYDGDKRIVPVIGDLEHLADVKINDNIDFVIHTAASVKHYGSYQYFYDMNVGGTLGAISFAKTHSAKLIHISTLSVSGNGLADNFDVHRNEEEKDFYESTLYIDQPLDNVYIRSKFEAEKAVFDAMLSGLEANIIRVGNLTNRKTDAKFQKNYKSNAFLNRIKAVLEFGHFPDYLMHLYAEFSPVDDTANAIVTIAKHFNNKFTVFNANNHKNLYFDKMFNYLSKLDINIRQIGNADFINRLKSPEYMPIYEALVNDMDENGKLLYDSNIKIHNEFTVEYLRQLGFEWSDIDFEYIKKYIEYFREIGYFTV